VSADAGWCGQCYAPLGPSTESSEKEVASATDAVDGVVAVTCGSRSDLATLRGCFDVCFHGCYFLLSGRAGLFAENGCNLLSNCGFENNHQAAGGFADENAGIVLQTFGTLIGCTGYSVFKQSRLIRAALDGRLVIFQDKSVSLARLMKPAGEPTDHVPLRPRIPSPSRSRPSPTPSSSRSA